MATNLQIDTDMLNDAEALYHFKTKSETVNFALEYIIREKRKNDLLGLAGSIDFDEKYDYIKERKNGSSRISGID